MIDDFDPGYYACYTLRTCLSLECAGERRPVLTFIDDSYMCCACGTFRDPSEDS